MEFEEELIRPIVLIFGARLFGDCSVPDGFEFRKMKTLFLGGTAGGNREKHTESFSNSSWTILR